MLWDREPDEYAGFRANTYRYDYRKTRNLLVLTLDDTLHMWHAILHTPMHAQAMRSPCHPPARSRWASGKNSHHGAPEKHAIASANDRVRLGTDATAGPVSHRSAAGDEALDVAHVLVRAAPSQMDLFEDAVRTQPKRHQR